MRGTPEPSLYVRASRFAQVMNVGFLGMPILTILLGLAVGWDVAAIVAVSLMLTGLVVGVVRFSTLVCPECRTSLFSYHGIGVPRPVRKCTWCGTDLTTA